MPRNSQEYTLNMYMKEIDNWKGYYDCWEIYYMPLDKLHHLITINAWGHGIVDDDLIERLWEHVKEKREELHKLYPDNLPRPKEKKKKRKKYYGYGNDGPLPDNGNGGPFTPEFDPDMGWH